MKYYTHLITVLLVDKMDKYRNYPESERIVITYGLELFFNNILKLIAYLILGSIWNLFVETIIAIFVLAILRVLSGGYHSHTDLGCLLLSGIMIFLPIILSKYIFISKLSFIVFFLGILTVYYLYAPQDEKYIDASREELLRVKIYVILVLVGICLGSLFMDSQLGIIVMLVSLGQGVSLITKEIYDDKKSCYKKS